MQSIEELMSRRPTGGPEIGPTVDTTSRSEDPRTKLEEV